MNDGSARDAMRGREEYRHFRTIPTRWQDNDAYGHLNNVVYYELIDTAVNGFLIECGLLDYASGGIIGLLVESGCRYTKPISFPEPVTVGLRVVRIGNSSVRYEAGLFSGDDAAPSAQGYYVHVYVDRTSMRPVVLPEHLRDLLRPLLVSSSADR